MVFFRSAVTVARGGDVGEGRGKEGAADVSSAAWCCLSVNDWRLMSTAEVERKHDVQLSVEHFPVTPPTPDPDTH